MTIRAEQAPGHKRSVGRSLDCLRSFDVQSVCGKGAEVSQIFEQKGMPPKSEAKNPAQP